MSKNAGFTIIELLVSIAVLLSLLSIGLPNLTNFLVTTRVDNEIASIQRLLLLTRNTAINSNTQVTLCPLNQESRCANSWHQELSVFIDTNQNKIYEPHLNERLVSQKAAIKHGDKLQYGKTKIGITYSPTGHLSGWGQNATFSYCPENHHDKNKGIVVARSGRSYISSIKNSTQLHVKRSGTKISCA